MARFFMLPEGAAGSRAFLGRRQLDDPGASSSQKVGLAAFARLQRCRSLTLGGSPGSDPPLAVDDRAASRPGASRLSRAGGKSSSIRPRFLRSTLERVPFSPFFHDDAFR